MRVFLSSTYEDLREHRRVLIDTLQKMGDGFKVTAMEHFGADPRKPFELCQEKVAESDVYIGMFGWRYGNVEPGSKLSMTELEYRTALAKNKPTYLYFLAENQAVAPSLVDVGASATKIRRLKEEMTGRHVIQRFTTPEDLARLVVADLARSLREHRPEPFQGHSLDGPVGKEINPSHPYMLCHTWHRLSGGKWYEVQMYLDVYEDDPPERRRLIQAVERVVYQVHKSFIIPVVPMQNWEDNFLFEATVWGEFWVRGTIFFRDSAREPVSLLRYINLLPLEDISVRKEDE